jgi:hypothetical protein
VLEDLSALSKVAARSNDTLDTSFGGADVFATKLNTQKIGSCFIGTAPLCKLTRE